MKNKVILSVVVVAMLLSMGSGVQAVTLDVTDDAPIDQHQNWRTDVKGIPGPWTDAQSMRLTLYGDGYVDPDPPGYTEMHEDILLKFDISSVVGTTLPGDAELRLAGKDGQDVGCDVYAIVADPDIWSEATTSWQSWTDTPGISLTLLGSFVSAGNVSAGDPYTTFSNVALTNLVQAWADGTTANNGIWRVTTRRTSTSGSIWTRTPAKSSSLPFLAIAIEVTTGWG